ncbi:hypothetical protein LAG90_00215 [Marinilongibacter aquaticus]|uniref:hypothetical protein n=1 Tax=Marinilongibacter aquaticus TaxID=2975157 RepID=UPI0021BD0478|nr:hypothetical protein [Marinilongibacter aquaticus]UBM59083.1 hypothetical protein LAG90_00215 [Marinilongibacter aquaticus]
MKRSSTIKLLLFFALAFSLASCGYLQEDITLDKQGKGKYQFKLDFYESIRIFSDFIASQDTLSASEKDSLKMTFNKSDLFESLCGPTGKMDSTFSVPEDVSAHFDEAQKRIWNNTKVEMHCDQAHNELYFFIENTFDNVDLLNQFLLESEKNNRQQSGQPIDESLKSPVRLEKGTNSVTLYNQITNSEADSSFANDMEIYDLTKVEQSFTVHLPYKIKKVESPYTYRIDNKSVTFTFPMEKYFKGHLEGKSVIYMKGKFKN